MSLPEPTRPQSPHSPGLLLPQPATSNTTAQPQQQQSGSQGQTTQASPAILHPTSQILTKDDQLQKLASSARPKIDLYYADKQDKGVLARDWLLMQRSKCNTALITDSALQAYHIAVHGLKGMAQRWLIPYLRLPTPWGTAHPLYSCDNLLKALEQITGQHITDEILAHRKIANVRPERFRKAGIQAYNQWFISVGTRLPADIRASKEIMSRYYRQGLDE